MNHCRELYFIENKKKHMTYFIYGFSFECNRLVFSGKLQDVSPKALSKQPNLKLLVLKDVVKKEDNTILNELIGSEIFQFSDRKINISLKLKRRPPIYQTDSATLQSLDIKKSMVPPESIAEYLVKSDTFWMIDKTDYLMSIVDPAGTADYKLIQEKLALILSQIEESTGLSFTQAYSARIGNYEHFTPLLGEEIVDIKIEVIHEMEHDINGKSKSLYGKGIRIIRSQELLNRNMIANVQLKNANDIIIDKIVFLKKDEISVEINSLEPISWYYIKIFDEENNKVFEQSYPLVRQICLNVGILGDIYSVKSKLSEKLEKRLPENKKDILNQVNEVKRKTYPSKSISGDYKYDPWTPSAREARTVITGMLEKPQYSRWFPTGALNETECFFYIKEILNNIENREVIIVDPFFSAMAFTSYIPRIENVGAEYKILTCIHSIDPDTEIKSDIETERKRIISICEESKDTIIPNVTLVTIGTSKKPKFHDRYIITKNGSDEITVYSLSNSLSRAAGLFPMCITQLESPVGKDVYQYIQDLLQGVYYDQNGNKHNIEPDIIWQKKQEHIYTDSDNMDSLFENGPKSYPYCELFFQKLLVIGNKKQLIDQLKKEEFIQQNNEEKWKWRINKEKLIVKFQAVKNIDLADQLPFFLIGFGETLARTADSFELVKTTHQWLKQQGIQFCRKEVLSAILGFYRDNNKKRETHEDLQYRALFFAEELDFNILDSCKKIFSFPGHFFGFYGLQSLFDLSIIEDADTLLLWAKAESGFVKYYTFLLKYFEEKIIHPDSKSLLKALLRSEKPVFKAIGCSYLVWQLTVNNENLKRYSFSKCVQLMKDNGILEGDILWILAMGGIAFLRGNNVNDNAKNLADKYLEKLLPLYKNQLVEEQQKKLISSLSRSTLIYNFAKKVYDLYEDREKVLFLWNECVSQFNNTLENDNIYLGDDVRKDGFEILEIATRCFINIHGIENIYASFIENYSQIFNELSARLQSLFFRKKSYSEWSNHITKSLLLFYLGYNLLILEKEINDTYSEKLEEHLLEKLESMVFWELNKWQDFSGLMSRSVNIISFFYQSIKIDRVAPVFNKIITSKSSPEYMSMMFICTLDKEFVNYQNKLPIFAERFIENETNMKTSIFNLIDFWIYRSFESGLIDQDKINSVIELALLKCGNIEDKWKIYYESILPALKGNEADINKIINDPFYENMRSIGLLKGGSV